MEVEIKNLKKVYGEFTAVDVPYLYFPSGSVTAVVGPNGAGKSTLLSLIAGLPEKSGGQILYDGDEAPPLRQMTMVFQEPYLISSTVGKNIAYPLRIRGMQKEEIRRRVGKLADELGLGPLLDRRVRGLSLGEIQKTALARAVSFGPELLMLDEPCASIDTHATLEIERMLLKSNMERHTTIILVTHDLAQARRVAGRIVLLNHGKVVECSEAERFFRHPDRDETKKFIEGKLLI